MYKQSSQLMSVPNCVMDVLITQLFKLSRNVHKALCKFSPLKLMDWMSLGSKVEKLGYLCSEEKRSQADLDFLALSYQKLKSCSQGLLDLSRPHQVSPSPSLSLSYLSFSLSLKHTHTHALALSLFLPPSACVCAWVVLSPSFSGLVPCSLSLSCAFTKRFFFSHFSVVVRLLI